MERVAVFGDGQQGVTREELGEYLIARFGEKVEHLINHRIIEDACKARGIEVTAKEVEQKLAEDLSDLNIDRAKLVEQFQRQSVHLFGARHGGERNAAFRPFEIDRFASHGRRLGHANAASSPDSRAMSSV